MQLQLSSLFMTLENTLPGTKRAGRNTYQSSRGVVLKISPDRGYNALMLEARKDYTR